MTARDFEFLDDETLFLPYQGLQLSDFYKASQTTAKFNTPPSQKLPEYRNYQKRVTVVMFTGETRN